MSAWYRFGYMYSTGQLRVYAKHLEKAGFTKEQIKALYYLLFHTAIEEEKPNET